MSELRAVLGIYNSGRSKSADAYRIIDEQSKQTIDVSINKIKAALKNDTPIKGLQLQDNKIVETEEIQHLLRIKSGGISLEQWCKEHGERGARILQEFNNGNNFPITAKDIGYGSKLKLGFKCQACQKINKQIVANKTGENVDCKCKFCANRDHERQYEKGTTLLKWCQANGTRGQRILQEYLSAPNELPPDKISYASNKKANFKCLKCGNINEQVITNKTSKNNGCKYCCKTTTSYSEQLIFLFLKANGLEVYNRYKLHEKEYDLYLPQLNLVIEHQSSLHARIDKEVYDQFGGYEAQSLGLQLLEVCCIDNKYQRTDATNTIVYKQNHEQEMIQQLVVWLYQNYNIQLNMNLYTRQLEDEAYLASCKVKYEDSLAFKRPDLCEEWNQQLNGIITPDKVAANSRRKYYWHCRVCNHVWLASPDSRNNMGSGCPNYRQHKHFQ